MNIFKLQKPASGVESPRSSINDGSGERVVFGNSLLGQGTAATAAGHHKHESWVDKLGVWHKRIL